MLHNTGVYQILNTQTKARYVGSSVAMRTRWSKHRRLLARGEHHSKRLQNAWNKYGPEAFIFEPVVICGKNMLLFYEQQVLNAFRSSRVYNAAPVVGGRLFMKNTKEHNAKIARAHTGRKHSAETKQKLSDLNSGKIMPAETKAKISAALLGKKHNSPKDTISEAHKEAIRSALLGCKRSPETIAKMRIAARARVAKRKLAWGCEP